MKKRSPSDRDAAVTGHLTRISLFRSLTSAERVRIVEVMERRLYRAGVTFRADRSVVLILRGRLDIRDSCQKLCRVLHPGDHIGDTSILARRAPALAATAAEESECLVLSAPRLRALLKREPAMALTLLANASSRTAAAARLLRWRERQSSRPTGAGDGPLYDQLLRYATDLQRVFAEERQRRIELRALLLNTVRALAAAIDARDPYTHGHSARVSALAAEIARRSGEEPNAVSEIEIGAYLHDVGKIGVEDLVLRKEGPLTDSEWAAIRRHPAIGADILQPVGFAPTIRAIVRHHHERVDGGGYPDRLRCEEIPLCARIVAVCDAYDAMTSARTYRAPLSPALALAELRTTAGRQCDPRIVELLASVLADQVGSEHERPGLHTSGQRDLSA